MDDHRVNKVIGRTAKRISNVLDKMVADLPEDAAPQMAIEFVIKDLAILQPWFMQLIMEEFDMREAYGAAVAAVPIKPKGKGKE